MIYDVLILGAGLAGLRAARELHSAGRRVLVLDKSRGVSGRAATRRWDGVPVDHGAQFFTARSDSFKAQVADWQQRGICFEWTRAFHQWDDDGRGLRAPDLKNDSHARYVCRAGMSALGKDLASGLPADTVRLHARVTALARTPGHHWQATLADTADQPAARRILFALPIPQALALLAGTALDPAARRTLEQVEIEPSLAVLLRGPAPKPAWQAIQLRDHVLTWMSDDTDKRAGLTPPGTRIIILHGDGNFSREWQDRDLDEAARRMVARAGELVGDWITTLPDQQIHRWRFARTPNGLEKQSHVRANDGLYFAGDAFLGSKIEGAYRSGQEAAQAILAD